MGVRACEGTNFTHTSQAVIPDQHGAAVRRCGIQYQNVLRSKTFLFSSLWRMPESIPAAFMDTGMRQYDEAEGAGVLLPQKAQFKHHGL